MVREASTLVRRFRESFVARTPSSYVVVIPARTVMILSFAAVSPPCFGLTGAQTV